METLTVSRNCQECGKALHGRIDQKFCSDMCRTSANNRIVREQMNGSIDSRRVVNHILKNNYRILNSLRERGLEFSLMYLRDLGFSFRYFTAFEDNISYCYDFGYVVQEDQVRLL